SRNVKRSDKLPGSRVPQLYTAMMRWPRRSWPFLKGNNMAKKDADKFGAAMNRSTRSVGIGFSSSSSTKPVEETVRSAIELEKDFHRRLKITAAQHEMSQRDLVLEALRKTYPELQD